MTEAELKKKRISSEHTRQGRASLKTKWMTFCKNARSFGFLENGTHSLPTDTSSSTISENTAIAQALNQTPTPCSQPTSTQAKTTSFKSSITSLRKTKFYVTPKSQNTQLNNLTKSKEQQSSFATSGTLKKKKSLTALESESHTFAKFSPQSTQNLKTQF